MRQAVTTHRPGCSCKCYEENIKNIKEKSCLPVRGSDSSLPIATKTERFEVVDINSLPSPDVVPKPVRSEVSVQSDVEYPSFELLNSAQLDDFGNRSTKKCQQTEQMPYYKL